MTEIVKLHHVEAGKGTPVVLLHGFPLSGTIWQSQLQALSDQFRVIAPDLRGHGQSPAPPGVYEMETLARDVLALLDALGVKRAVILGHSMGGYVTLAAAKLAPERFLALGLVSSQAAADSEEGRQGRFKLAGQVAAAGSSAVAEAMLPRLFTPGLAAGNPVVEEVHQIILSTPRAGIIGSLNGMAMRPNTERLLSGMTVPVLLLAGARDQIISAEKSQALAALVPKSTLVLVDNAGHMTMLEQPEATTTAIREFLNATVG
jgi:pimeloyl-ACP methyl ester carboxylesterase